MKKFPHLVQMHRDWSAKGLVVLGVTTDEPEDTSKVIEFLKLKSATFPNVLLKDTDANAKKHEDTYPTFPQPMLWVYDRTGKKVLHDEGKMKPDQVDEIVKKLL